MSVDWTSHALVNIPALILVHRRSHVSSQRYALELKEEAVRQVLERGHSVAEVSERLDVSALSLYKWIKSVQPDKSEQAEKELLEANREILKLRAQIQRSEEERDILKKAARCFASQPE
jgi:transposase